jgi:hypothetical protein
MPAAQGPASAISGWLRPAVIEPLLRKQPCGSKGLLRVIRAGRLGSQLLGELLHLHEITLDAREALRILRSQVQSGGLAAG